MAIRYRTVRRAGRAAEGKLSPRSAQYLIRRMLMQGTGGQGRAAPTARPGAAPAVEQPKVITNYRNPVIQNGRRVN